MARGIVSLSVFGFLLLFILVFLRCLWMTLAQSFIFASSNALFFLRHFHLPPAIFQHHSITRNNVFFQFSWRPEHRDIDAMMIITRSTNYRCKLDATISDRWRAPLILTRQERMHVFRDSTTNWRKLLTTTEPDNHLVLRSSLFEWPPDARLNNEILIISFCTRKYLLWKSICGNEWRINFEEKKI